jgi:putative YphP/YqiW family bacilliredoxin
MREELTHLGVKELKTPALVDSFIREPPGTVMVVVNSMCGCAAGKARPGVAEALQHARRPDAVATVFAGGDLDATERARSYFLPYPPSSPSVALLREGRAPSRSTARNPIWPRRCDGRIGARRARGSPGDLTRESEDAPIAINLAPRRCWASD